jgi:ABC-type antimicrobial peptide transport system permease subunit
MGTSKNVRPSIVIMCLMLSITFTHTIFSQSPQMLSQAEIDHLIGETLTELNYTNVVRHVVNLGQLSRFTGYPGFYEAAQYIVDELRKVGLEPEIEEYNISIPVDKGSKLMVVDPKREEINAYALLPNVIQTCKGVYKGHLVYVGRGSLSELNGIGVTINGSIVLMDFNSRENWVYAMRLGARAVVFIEPPDTVRGEADVKYLDVPVKFPRVYIKAEDGAKLLDLLKKYGNGKVQVILTVNMDWEVVKASNIIAVINGTDPNEWERAVALVAHYDAASIVPGLAPGASEATGPAALLEIARILARHPPRRSVWFVFLSGHAQALAGARDFVWHRKVEVGSGKYFVYHYSHIGTNDNKSLVPHTIWMAFGLDFSTETSAVAVVAGGTFYGVHVWFDWYGYNDLHAWLITRSNYGDYAPLERRAGAERGLLSLGSKELRARLGRSLTYEVCGLRPDRSYLQAPAAFEASVLAQVGIWGLTFTTAYTVRPYYGTPLDTLERLKLDNLKPQVELAAVLIRMILNDPMITYDRASIQGGAIPTHTHFNTGGLGFVVVLGRVGRWNMTSGWYSYEWSPMLGDKYLMLLHVKVSKGIELEGHEWIEVAGSNGTFIVKGLYPSVGWAVPEAEYMVLPYVVDRESGDVVFAPDFGTYGTRSWPYGFTFYTTGDELIDGSGRKLVNLAVFNASIIALHDVFDPRSLLSPLWGTSIVALDQSGVRLETYAVLISSPPRFETPHKITLADPVTGYEAVVFVPSNRRVQLVIQGGADVIGFLINKGEGLLASNRYVDTSPTLLRIVDDMIQVTGERVELLRTRGLLGAAAQTILDSYAKALAYRDAARKAIEEHRYGDFYTYIVQAWYYAYFAYDQSKSIIADAGTTIVAFFLLILPCAYLLERLVLRREGVSRVLSLAGITGILLLTLYSFHPGFAVSPTAALTAFGALALILVIPVLVLMMSDTAGVIRAYKEELLGPLYIRADKLALFLTSLGIGVENLRRRKSRTVLTIIGVTLVTFSFVSFLAISPTWVTQRVPPPQRPAVAWQPHYIGVLITRREPFAPINPLLVDIVMFKYGKVAYVAPRAWIPQPSGTTYTIMNMSGYSAPVSGIIGLSVNEIHALGLHEAIKDSISPWFTLEDAFVCYITEDIARKLSLKPGDNVYLYGMKLMVLGTVDNNILEHIYDINGQQMVPFDPLYTGPGRKPAYWGIVYVPYKLLLNLGGYPFSVAIVTSNATLAEEIAEELSSYIGYYMHDVYASLGKSSDECYLFNRRQIHFIGGWQFVTIPLVIGTLMLVSVIMGVLYERTRDIYVYAVVGAAPLEVSAIFLGEVLTYAFISAPLGYILALVLGPAAAGSLLNYASTSVLVSIGISLLAVLTSSVYPAYKAAKLVTPSLERRWRPPTKPRGDRWEIPLPFSVRSEPEVKGVLAFLGEFLKAYGSEVEPFTVASHEYARVQVDSETVYTLRMIVRLRPYEAGVEERVTVTAAKVGRGIPRYAFSMVAEHTGGPRNLWLTGHLRFVDEVRRRLLVWGSVVGEEREKYIKMGEVVFK